MEIKLCGYKVLIDDEDFEKVTKLTWHTNIGCDKNRYIYFDSTKVYDPKKGWATIRLHRLLLSIELYDKRKVDHINGNTLDNRKSNLRICTNQQNCMNSKKSKNNTTGYKGVTYDREREMYRAQIMTNRKQKYLGLYMSPELAHIAYCEASIKYHGEFGRTE